MADQLAIAHGPFKKIAAKFAISEWNLTLLIFFVANAFVLNAALYYLSPENHQETALHHTSLLFKSESSDDSWGPMKAALEQVQSEPNVLLYSEIFFDQGKRFQYPPSALFALQAMELAGENRVRTNEGMVFSTWPSVNDIVGWLFIALTYAASFTVLELMLRHHPLAGHSKLDRMVRAALAAGFTLTFYPVIKAFTLGQIQTWINALLAAALLFWALNRKALCGVLVGAVCLIKPHYSLFLIWAALRKEWRFTVACFAIAIAGLGAAIIAFGFQNHLDYLRVLSFLSERGEAYYPNHSINGLLNRMMALTDPDNYLILEFPDGKFASYSWIVHSLTVATSGVILALALWVRKRKEENASTVDFAIIMLSLTMASPIAWEHHYGILLPIFAVLVATLKSSRSLAWLGLAYVLSSNYYNVTHLLAETPFNILQSYILLAALIVLTLLHLQSPPNLRFHLRSNA